MSRTKIPEKMKRVVLHAQGIHCLRCRTRTVGTSGLDISREFDHVIPENLGGLTWVGNLQVLCRKCNRRKGNSTEDYRGGGWYQPPIHLAENVGGCRFVDHTTVHPGVWDPVAERFRNPRRPRKIVTTTDPFAVTCFDCLDKPRMRWFEARLAEALEDAPRARRRARDAARRAKALEEASSSAQYQVHASVPGR